MPDLEYDRFFYDGENIELHGALDGEGQDLLPKYDKDSLYCPECKKAQLTFTQRTSRHRAFLSTRSPWALNNNKHDPRCSHSFPRATKSQIKQYYSSLSDAQIANKLTAAISRFLRNKSKAGDEMSLQDLNQNPAIARVKEKGQQVHRRLPKRSLYNIYDITDDELDVPILLYGIVKLRVEERESDFYVGHYYRLCSAK